VRLARRLCVAAIFATFLLRAGFAAPSDKLTSVSPMFLRVRWRGFERFRLAERDRLRADFCAGVPKNLICLADILRRRRFAGFAICTLL
jgi:hypothetical protein